MLKIKRILIIRKIKNPKKIQIPEKIKQEPEEFVEILMEKTEKFTGIEEEENGKMLSSEIGNITHSVIDS
ncbi:3653_t:CDS:2 [Ambispora leptoticha]|uniref:3653_t:CDS:1 n=1 Tax=Ambispora leptoticha TaxID=144679 RepID=A0A9N8ZEM4_9GLOM|nr:3653_t:CDS:2 [Ambispora leptoticha]